MRHGARGRGAGARDAARAVRLRCFAADMAVVVLVVLASRPARMSSAPRAVITAAIAGRIDNIDAMV